MEQLDCEVRLAEIEEEKNITEKRNVNVASEREISPNGIGRLLNGKDRKNLEELDCDVRPREDIHLVRKTEFFFFSREIIENQRIRIRGYY